MKLPHSGNNRLSRFLIRTHAKRRIFFRQLPKRRSHFFLVGFGLWFNRDIDHRLREVHRFQNNGVCRIAKRVSRRGIFESHNRSDFSASHFRHFFAMIGMHTKHATDTLLGILRRVEHVRSGRQHTRVHAEERNLSHERIRRHLKHQCGKRFDICRMSLHFGTRFHIRSFNGGYVLRCGQIVDHRIKHQLHTLVAKRRSDKYRNETHGNHRLAQRGFQFRHANFLAAQVFFRERVVRFGNFFHHFFAPLFGFVEILRGNFAFVDNLPHLSGKSKRAHGHKIDHA